jgi:hypothetical protein
MYAKPGRPRTRNIQSTVFTPEEKARSKIRQRIRGQDARDDARTLEYISRMNYSTRELYMRWKYGLSSKYKADFPSEGSAATLEQWALIDMQLKELEQLDLRRRHAQRVTKRHIDRVKTHVRMPAIPIPREGSYAYQNEWKADVDCPLFFSKKYEYTHGILEPREITVASLIDNSALRFHNLLNLLNDVIRSYLKDSGQEVLDVEDIALDALYQLDFGKWDDENQKLRRYFSSDRHTVSFPSPYLPYTLPAMYRESRETFYSVMAKFSVVLHKVMDWLVRRQQQASYRFYHTVSKHERQYRIYLWPLLWEKLTATPHASIYDTHPLPWEFPLAVLNREPLKDLTSEGRGSNKLPISVDQARDYMKPKYAAYCDLEIHHLTFFAQFHPLHVPSGHFRRCDSVRKLLTDDELMYLTTVIDETVFFKDIRFKTREKRVYDPVAKRVTREKVDPNESIRRGYFIGREASRLASGRVSLDVEEYIAWLRQSYHPDLTPVQETGEKKVVFLAERVELSRGERNEQGRRMYGELRQVLQDFHDEDMENFRDPSNHTLVQKFLDWLQDPNAENKGEFQGKSLSTADFLALDTDTQRWILKDHIPFHEGVIADLQGGYLEQLPAPEGWILH